MVPQPSLTFQQQWLWGLVRGHRSWNCSVAYAFCLKGELDIPLLRRSLQSVICRHSALRAELDRGAERLDVTQVVGDTEPQIEENARQAFAKFAESVVDPVTDPLLSLRLLTLGDREHWLLVAIHRLMADCFSADQIFRELWWLYRGDPQKRPADIPADPPQYTDYVLWQQKTDADWQSRHAPYWQSRLEGARILRWPEDRAADRDARGVNGRMRRWFGSEVSARLQDLSRQTRSLSAIVMLSVYVAVLWRWCRQTDFIVPFYVAGRQSEHKFIVGYFSHLLYLRIELTGKESFADLLKRLSNEFFRALSHQDFGRMTLSRPELLSGALFQWVTWHPEGAVNPCTTAEPAEIHIERLPLKDFAEGLSALPPGMVDVDITFFDTHEGLYAQGVYRADRFSSATIERFLDDLRAAAHLFVHDPLSTLETACRSISSVHKDGPSIVRNP